jgi:hypothetical protein
LVSNLVDKAAELCSENEQHKPFENKAKAFHATLNFFFSPQMMVTTVVLTLYVIAVQLFKSYMDSHNKFIYISNAGFNLYVLVLFLWGCSIATANVLHKFKMFGAVFLQNFRWVSANACSCLGLSGCQLADDNKDKSNNHDSSMELRQDVEACPSEPSPLPERVESILSLSQQFFQSVFLEKDLLRDTFQVTVNPMASKRGLNPSTAPAASNSFSRGITPTAVDLVVHGSNVHADPNQGSQRDNYSGRIMLPTSELGMRGTGDLDGSRGSSGSEVVRSSGQTISNATSVRVTAENDHLRGTSGSVGHNSTATAPATKLSVNTGGIAPGVGTESESRRSDFSRAVVKHPLHIDKYAQLI